MATKTTDTAHIAQTSTALHGAKRMWRSTRRLKVGRCSLMDDEPSGWVQGVIVPRAPSRERYGPLFRPLDYGLTQPLVETTSPPGRRLSGW